MTIWLIFFTLFAYFESLYAVDGLCYKTPGLFYSDILTFLLPVMSLIFTAITYHNAKKLNLQHSLTVHNIFQTRNVCFLYFTFWFPSLVMNVVSGPLWPNNYARKPDHFRKEKYFFRVLAYVLEYVSVAVFPLLCKTMKDVVVEHELP